MPSKLCHICGSIASRTCSVCGRPTCDKHFAKDKDICETCAQGRRMK